MIAVRLRGGRVIHVVGSGASTTLCGLDAATCVIRPDVPTCKRCLRRLADGG